ncbi:MAG: hypothetical protein K2N14_03110 [Clostridia bacterium]|nr:hypothetical protein [Clostridia bacterium]
MSQLLFNRRQRGEVTKLSKILTPISLWQNFNDKLEVMPVTLGERVDDGVKFEYLNFSGRDTGMGRVTVYGVLATRETNAPKECVLILRDSLEEIDEDMLAYFVKCGYNALCVDYGGERDGVDRYTQYPTNVKYADAVASMKVKDRVDSSADKTCWYEWVAVGIYARKFLSERFLTDSIGLVGVRDGGEIAWKLAYAAKFSCAVTIGACGWKAYRGLSKFHGTEPEFNDERYRFVAGIDSQSYAPYVRCPMLVLCNTSDPSFDYDRAYDTFSRINPEFAGLSAITYSINCGSVIDAKSTNDLLMFLDSNVKDRHVFMPKPVELNIVTDEQDNLIVKLNCDTMGIIEKCGVYFAEDCYDYATRDWSGAPLKRVVNASESEFYLNLYEKASVVFVLGYAVYSNGFTVWSKLTVRRVSGTFRNSRAKSKILYIANFGTECFSLADCSDYTVGGILLTNNDMLTKSVKMEGLTGIYSVCGLKTYRIMSPQFAPDKDSILKFDVCSEEDINLVVRLKNNADGNIYTVKVYVLGGVWQSETLKAKLFKNRNGVSLTDFTQCEYLTVSGSDKFALNNLIWL